MLTQPTLAYYTYIGKATNVVTSGDIQLMIHEKTADGSNFPEKGVYIIPGDIVSKQVSIGKGNLTMDELIAMINRYSIYFE